MNTIDRRTHVTRENHRRRGTTMKPILAIFNLQFIQAVPEPSQALMLRVGAAVIGSFSRLSRNHSVS